MRAGTPIARTLAVAACACVVICQFGRISIAADMLSVTLVPLLFVLAIITVFAFSQRDRFAAVLAIAGFTVAALQLFGAAFDVAPRLAAAGPVLRIASVNAYHDNGDPALLAATIARANPDILMVQEANGTAGAAVAKLLPGFYRVSSCAAPPCSLAILSRWPAVRIVDPSPPGASLPDLLIAQVRAPFGAFTVVTAHMPRMNRSYAAPARAMLADTLSAHGVLPTILGGDLNLPTGSFGLSRFERSTVLKRAERWIPTYPANLPVPAIAAIDHIYVGTGWEVRDCRRLDGVGSDHFGLACEIQPDWWTPDLDAVH